MAKKKKEDSFEELMKGIDWNRYLPAIIGIMQPMIIFGAWLGFAKIDSRADAVSKLIALAEPMPFEVDLNVPQPVVLASIYHSIDESLDVLEDVIKFLKDVDIPSAEDIIKEIKEELGEVIPGVADEGKFLQDFNACKKNAKDTLGILYNKYTAWPWITSCLVQKGYTRKVIEERVRQALGI